MIDIIRKVLARFKKPVPTINKSISEIFSSLKTDHYNEVIAFKISNGRLKILNNPRKDFSSKKISGLPKTLIMDPGVYHYKGEQFDCDAPGNYFFIHPIKSSEQRVIINKGSALETSLILSLLFMRGNVDDLVTDQAEVTDLAKRRYLFCTCSVSTRFVKKSLQDYGFKVRYVYTLATGQYNNYNNGHTLLEVFEEKEKRFVLVDIDKKLFFTNEEGRILNLYEFSEILANNTPVQINRGSPLSLVDWAGFTDTRSGFNYQFIETLFNFSDNELIQLYKRICAIPIIESGKRPSGTIFNKDYQDKANSIPILSNDDFKAKFYSEAE